MKRSMPVLLAGLLLPASAPAAPVITGHVLAVKLNPKRSAIEVSDRIHVEGLESSSFRFELNRALRIGSIRQEESELRWRSVEGGGGEDGLTHVIAVSLLGGLAKEADLRVEYSGIIHDSLWPPATAYARSFGQTSGLIDERGAFLSGSIAWMPTVRGSLFRFRLMTEVPRRWEMVSQGSLEGRSLSGATRITRWACDDPMEEIYPVAGSHLFEERSYGDISIRGFPYDREDQTDLWNTYAERTGVYLDRYSAEIGPYPFPKSAVVENFRQTGSGMPSFTLLRDRVIRLPFIPASRQFYPHDTRLPNDTTPSALAVIGSATNLPWGSSCCRPVSIFRNA